MYAHKSTFVDQIANRFQIGITPNDERIGNTEHADGGFVQFHKHSIVDLQKAQELESFSRTRV